jgi:hypothetical protein
MVISIATRGAINVNLLPLLKSVKEKVVIINKHNNILLQRNLQVLYALPYLGNNDWLIFIDDDVLPNKIPTRQELERYGSEVVCGLYPLKTFKGLSVGKGIQWLKISEIRDGDDVDFCGLGLTAFKGSFIKELFKKTEGRIFNVSYSVINNNYVFYGEDLVFFLMHKPRTKVMRDWLGVHFIDNITGLNPDFTISLYNDIITL